MNLLGLCWLMICFYCYSDVVDLGDSSVLGY